MSHENHPLSAGTPVRAVDFPPARFYADQTSQLNLTGTTYGEGDPEVAVRFQAPTSGRVAVVLSAGVRNNTAANQDRVFVSFRIFEGDPADNDLIQTEEVKYGRSTYSAAQSADDYEYGGHLTIVGGLDPGTFYYAQVRHRVTIGSGTADIAVRSIMVFPVP